VKRAGWIALLGAAAFAAILVGGLPASWLVPSRFAGGSCASIDGSLWSGTCSGLTVSGTTLGDLNWELHPLKLFVGRLAAHLTLGNGPTDAAADVELGFGQKVTVRNLSANLPLDPKLVPIVPPTLHGSARADVQLARFEHGVLSELQGELEAHDLVDTSGQRTPLGSYRVSFPGGSGTPTGQLHDLDGPLAVEGTLKFTPQPGFEVQGVIAARNGAPQELVNNIRFLGSPDASGRRPFSFSGSF
jgi:general secretion pathway protein N